MKNAVICHGTGSTPESFWIPSIRNFLVKIGYSVYSPQLPNSNSPDLRECLPLILNSGSFNSETIMIGHSSGGPLILSVLESIDTKISKVILVAGYARPKGKNKEKDLILQDVYNWKKIKSNVKDLIFINSNDDPWGCDDKEGLYMWNNLGGTLILRTGEGHMGSDIFNQPYKSFPLLEKLVEL